MNTHAHKTQKAVIYVRVSSQGQVTKGHGAESQAVRCREFAKVKGYDVVRVFEDKAVSGSVTDRPGMKQMLAYLNQHRGDGVRVLIDDISRLARGMQAHLTLRTLIAEAGGLLESPSIEFGEDSDSQLIEHMLASVSEHQRVKNAEQTRNRMQARMTAGYWPFGPCLGFKSRTLEGHGKVMVRDEPVASIIQEGLEGFASGRFQSQAEVKRFFESQPEFPKSKTGHIPIHKVTVILTRVLYAGMVESKKWGVSLREGKHESLISFETYQKIQDRIMGRSCTAYRGDIAHDFPLRGTVACGSCEHPMTANWSRSAAGKKHPYYICHQKGCDMYRKSVKREDVEGAFETLLMQMVPSRNLLDMAAAMFKTIWDSQAERSKETLNALYAQITQIEKEIGVIVDRIVEAKHARVVTALEGKIDGLDKRKLVLTEKLANAPVSERPFEEMFERTMAFLANPYNTWKNGSYELKQTVQRLAFKSPIPFVRGEGFRTPQTSSVFRWLSDLVDKDCKMVRPRRLELPRACAHSDLNAARLPIPPRPHTEVTRLYGEFASL